MRSRILTINGGSSTIKFSAFCSNEKPERILAGKVEGIGKSHAELSAKDTSRAEMHHVVIRAGDHREAAHRLIDWIVEWTGQERIQAIGHRVVHGGVKLDRHQVVTPDLVRELCRTQPLDLAHLPREIALIEAFHERFPGVVQIACFDTAFNRALPKIAQILPVPRRYFEAGIKRLGFHGLSYMYLLEELRRIAGTAADGRLILAHLGSGASMTALSQGVPVDTSMAFTPTSGLMMGTRSGDLDPGLLIYIMRTEKLTPEQMDEFVSHGCGMAGVSESTSDMRELIAGRAHDEKAQDAFDLFCYQAKKWIGAYAAVLGGLETLVFSGGIGENSPEVRASICDGLDFLGIQLDPSLNVSVNGNAGVISAPESRVAVRVLPTDEELMIARIVFGLITEN
ncbi:MAG TPA: acetate/propionate family kinase [Bryobacteraceae bacterium]|nr:acetate/propionate family kinase [Bryobacteraceae bacterium]